MKKRILVLLMMISMVAVLLAACGKEDKESSTENDNKDTQNTTDKKQEDDDKDEQDKEDKEDKEVSGDFTLSDTSDLEVKYRGQTVEEFVMTGAEIRGYTGVGGYYDFRGINEEKGEIYTFTLSGEGLKEKLDDMEFTDDYEDVIGEFEIDSIEVILVNDPALQEFVGITVEDFEKAGFEITGFANMGDFVLTTQTKSGHNISITLEGDAKEKYESIEEPFDADMGAEFAKFVIKTVEFSVY